MIMQRFPVLVSALTVLLSFNIASCGGSDDDDDAPAVIKYGELKTSLLDSTEVRTADLTGATCTSSSDTGLFTGMFTGGSGEILDIKIKDFSTAARTYNCAQAETNRDGDLGEKYTGCAVEFTIPGTGTGAGLNSYATYRNADTTGAFTFTGACTVTTSYVAPKVSLTISCANLIQTKFDGAPRNPISATEVATVTSTTAECSIEKGRYLCRSRSIIYCREILKSCLGRTEAVQRPNSPSSPPKPPCSRDLTGESVLPILMARAHSQVSLVSIV